MNKFFEEIKNKYNSIKEYLVNNKIFQITLYVIYIISNLLYIASITIGTLYINDCAIQNYIPIWYIIIFRIYLFSLFIF
jgi:hypothetical protein